MSPAPVGFIWGPDETTTFSHAAVWVQTPHRHGHRFALERVSLDVGIVDLVVVLWELGFETRFSCQGGPPTRPCNYPMGSREQAAYVVGRAQDNGPELFDAVFSSDPALAAVVVEEDRPSRRHFGATEVYAMYRRGNGIEIAGPPADVMALVEPLRDAARIR